MGLQSRTAGVQQGIALALWPERSWVAALGAIAGNSGTAERAAGVGGVIGGAKGAGSGLRERDRVVKNCLRGRGYRVLN